MKRFKFYWFFRKLYDKYFKKIDKSLIPSGMYCHRKTIQDPNNSMVRLRPNRCPYWDTNPYTNDQDFGYCSLLAEGDWECKGLSLWDQCKEYCGINDFEEDDE